MKIVKDILEINRVDEHYNVFTKECIEKMIEKTDVSTIPVTMGFSGVPTLAKVTKLFIEDNKLKCEIDFKITDFDATMGGESLGKSVSLGVNNKPIEKIENIELFEITLVDPKNKLRYLD